ncbi:hypothetical protein ACH5RR_001309 [Cinchona calisaya]|uniref:Uncharacterized protein n=1 Tax=Cinchona calisaya TaxID=153742 RepID=A0ABD3B3P7_9GENT
MMTTLVINVSEKRKEQAAKAFDLNLISLCSRNYGMREAPTLQKVASGSCEASLYEIEKPVNFTKCPSRHSKVMTQQVYHNLTVNKLPDQEGNSQLRTRKAGVNGDIHQQMTKVISCYAALKNLRARRLSTYAAVKIWFMSTLYQVARTDEVLMYSFQTEYQLM